MSPHNLENGRRYVLEASVKLRSDDVSITTQLDGQPFVKWSGPIASLERQSEPMFDAPHYLGFFTFDAQVAFHRLELTSHSGDVTPDADAVLPRPIAKPRRLPANLLDLVDVDVHA